MENSLLRESIVSAFKLHGFSLRSEATKYLIEVLGNVRNDTQRQDWIQRIVGTVNKQPLESALIDKDVVETAVRECGDRMEDENQKFSVLNVFQLMKHEYDSSRKRFVERSSLNLPELQLYGSADDKANVFRERYCVVYQRLLRHELFAPLTLDVGQQGNSGRYRLLTVEAMLASPSKVENVIAFGMVVQLKEDKFYLEDPTGVVHLSLAEAAFQSGLYTEGCLCLVEGSYEENALVATAIGFAPIESSANTFSHHFSSSAFETETFGSLTMKQSPKLLALEQERPDATLVIVSDVWLDSAMVLEKVRDLLSGFVDSPPVAVIIAGAYLSKHYGVSEPKVLKEGFKALAEMIQKFPNVAERTHFVFVPSLRDPFLTGILPRPPLPSGIVQPLASKIPHCHFATNPCRLRYCTQDIVVLREDIVEKMCRNCIRAPPVGDNEKSVEHHFAKTILAQSHLTPLPLHVSPVHWSYDYTLRLYPLPDLVVCCDKYKPYTESLNDCTVTNPGSFAKNFSFQIYIPATRRIEDSEISG